MEKISVLMPVYNREDFLERSINSILNQTYKNIELIIYDDGSSDNSFEIIQGFWKNDKRINVNVGWVNKGVGHARNVLLNVCNTKYAIWMDSDDISALNRIELQLKEMTEDKLVFCGWENLKTREVGTTRGFATLCFPVNKTISFPENMIFGAEDAVWRDAMEKVYTTTDINKVLYSIDFHGDRIGSWKRKIDKNWGGKYNLKDIEHLSYEEAIEKYKKEFKWI